MTKDEEIAQIERELADINKQVEEAKSLNPFYFFEPNGDNPTPDGIDILEKYLKPEDLPEVFDSQLNALSSDENVLFVSGGNQCLGGESLIYDPVTEESRRVDRIDSDFHVLAWDGKKLVKALAHKPFRKEVDKLYKYKLSTGDSFIASDKHKVLTPSGYESLCDIPLGSSLFLPQTNLDTSLLAHVRDAVRLTKKALSYLSDCHLSLRLCDEPLLSSTNGVAGASPSLNDDLKHKGQVSSHSDAQGYKAECNHPYLPFDLPSNQGGKTHHEALDVETVYQILNNTWKRACRKFQEVKLSLGASSYQPQPISSCGQNSSYNRSLIQFFSIYTKVITSFISKLSVKWVVTNPVTHIVSYTFVRDDFKWDFTVPNYHNYHHAGVIHHNSSKSVTGAIFTYIFLTRTIPDSLKGHFPEHILPDDKFARARVVGVDNKQLKNVVIPAFKQWCPRDFLDNGEWKNNYFSETKVLTLRKEGKEYGSIEFMTNEQDVDSFQGSPLDLLVYDEEPKEKIHRENLLRFTTAKRLQVLFCMTPTKGLSWTVKYTRHTEDDSGNKVKAFKLLPILNQKANLGVLDQILSQLDSYEEIKMRLLGEFVSLSGLVYPSFNRSKHVIEPFPIKYENHVVFRGLDPHQVTPTAVVWMAMDREGIAYIIDCYFGKNDNVQDLKDKVAEKSVDYRIGYSVADRSCDVSIHILEGINVYHILKSGKNSISGLRKSQKYSGSICSGVDEIRMRLKDGRLFIFDTPNNNQLIESMMSLERERFANEDDKGEKDKIKEGRHHMHAAMRYIFQYNPRWYENIQYVPQPENFLDEELFL